MQEEKPREVTAPENQQVSFYGQDITLYRSRSPQEEKEDSYPIFLSSDINS